METRGYDNDTEVLIVGGGPIGLALAAELGWRGVTAELVEKHEPTVSVAKALQINVRTMEFCRHLGIAERVAHWGFPLDFCMDNVFIAGGLNGWEIARVKMPVMGGANYSDVSPERQRQCPQTVFDPILRTTATSFPTVKLRYKTRLVSFEQDSSGISAECIGPSDVATRVRCKFMVDAGGYGSSVRRQLGIRSRGIEHLDTSLNVELNVSDPTPFEKFGTANRFVPIDQDGAWATFVALNGVGMWRLTLYGANDIDVESISVNEAIARLLGRGVSYTITNVSKWDRRMLVADSFRDGRVLIIGDSGHSHPPNSGLGMNTGIADVWNLGWKLEAVLRGWGGEFLLDSYDKERRPVCWDAVNQSLLGYRHLTEGTRGVNAITEDSIRGDAARRELGNRLREANANSWQLNGINLGYCYDPSPIVVPDTPHHPTPNSVDYVQSDAPGSRAPHKWLDQGLRKSTLDLFGRGFTLLTFADAPSRPFTAAAEELGVPVRVEKLNTPTCDRGPYTSRFCLVRPDGHVAWRGNDTGPASAARRVLQRASGRIRATCCRPGETDAGPSATCHQGVIADLPPRSEQQAPVERDRRVGDTSYA